MPQSKFPRSKEGIASKTQNREESVAPSRRVGGAKRPMNIAVVARQQAPEEERQTTTAIELLLAEMFGQQLGCQGETK